MAMAMKRLISSRNAEILATVVVVTKATATETANLAAFAAAPVETATAEV